MDTAVIQLDVSNMESVSSVLIQVFTDYSAPPAIVVNTTGITRDNFMLKMSVWDFKSVFNVNVKGTFLVTQTICKELVEKKLFGSISGYWQYSAIIQPVRQLSNFLVNR